MKKILMLALVLGLLASGCAVQKHCFIRPSLLEVETVTTGSVLVRKTECYGRVTVDQCVTPLELTYLGKTGSNIRIASRITIKRTPVITEILYPESSRFIEFQDVKIEIIEATDSWIKFKLIRISTQGCNKVNGQKVNEGVTK